MKTNLKKLLLFAFCFIMVVAAFSVTSFAADCEHTYYEWKTVISATNTKAGKMEKICLDCDEILDSATISANSCNHEYYAWKTTVNSSCTTTGTQVKICNLCSNTDLPQGVGSLGVDIVEAHTFTQIYRKDATCTQTGTVYRMCSVCFFSYNEILPVNSNHDMLSWVVTVAPTCNTLGEKESRCNRFGCTYFETEEIPFDEGAHVYKEGSPTTIKLSPTCETAGIEIFNCDVCKKDVEREIPCHTDTFVKYEEGKTVPSSCSHNGSQEVICTLCGFITTHSLPLDADAHYYRDWVVTNLPTKTQHGDKERTCVYCGFVDTDKESVHYFSEDAGVTECGFTNIKCSVCDEITTQENEDAHLQNVWVFESGNCAQGGEVNRYCNSCDAEHKNILETKYMAAETHPNVINITRVIEKAKCTTMGVVYGDCPDCNLTNVKAYVTSIGHIEPDYWTVVKKAVCRPVDYKEGDDLSDYEGLSEKYCLRCDEVLASETIDAYEHNFLCIEKGYETTCEIPGLTDYLYCSACGVYVPQTAIAPTGHNFVDQVMSEDASIKICDRCFEYRVILGTDDEGNDIVGVCSCMCHNTNPVGKFVFKIVNFFCKLFGFNQECKCGVLHY